MNYSFYSRFTQANRPESDRLAIMNSTELNIIYCADLTIDLQSGHIRSSNNQHTKLSPLNVRVLKLLSSQQGKVLSRTEIFSAIWPNQEISDDALTKCISDIRLGLSKHSTQSRFIETVPKKGYRWLLPLSDTPVIPNTATTSDTKNSIVHNAASKIFLPWPKLLPAYVMAALALLSLVVWLITYLSQQTQAHNIAIVAPHLFHGLPNKQTHNLNATIMQDYREALYSTFIRNKSFNILSEGATENNGQKIYPTLHKSFGTQWVIEAHLRERDQHILVTTSLVDARTALVVHRITNKYTLDKHWIEQEAAHFFNQTTNILSFY